MTSGATVTAAEIARIAGVGSAAVSNWRRRYAEFPTPVGGTAASPQFSLSEIVDWLKSHGRPVRLSPVDEVWRAMEARRDPRRPGGILAAVGFHLLGEEPPLSLGRAEAGTAGLPAELGPHVDGLRDRLGAAEAFEELLSLWVEAHARQVEVTPAPVAALMCALVGSVDDVALSSVLDPACGTGSLLLQAAKSGAAALLGQEAHSDLAEIAVVRLRLHGYHDVSVAPGDSLLGNAHAAARVRGVVCNFPFGQRDWGRSELGYDARWTYGLPPKGEPELAWVQHALAHLDDGGRAALLMPAAAASRPSGRRIRAELVRRGTLRAVVALPSGSTSAHSLGTHLWLVQPCEQPVSHRVLFVDTELLAGPASESRAGTDWEAVHTAVSAAWRQFQAGAELDPAFSSTAPVAELLDEDVDITPARHVRTDPGDTVDLVQMEEDRTHWRQTLAALADTLPTVRKATLSAPQVLVPLEDLIRSGVLRMWRGSSSREASDGKASQVPLVSLNDGLSRTPPSRQTYATEDECIREGDVLVFAGSPQGARPADPREHDAAAGQGITILRPEQDSLDSWFLAGALTGGPGVGRSGAATGATGRPSRLDPGRLFLPVRELEEQRRIGRAFRDIARFDETLDQVTVQGRRVARHLVDALAAGLADPIDDDKQD